MVRRRLIKDIGWGLPLLLSAVALAVGKPQAGLINCESASVQLYAGSVHTPVTTAIDPDLNSQLTLMCASKTDDGIIWFKNGEEISTATSAEYKIDAVKSVHGGQYECGVDTKSCGIIRSNMLHVNTPPQISALLGQATVAEGEGFSLTCSATGWPAPRIQWSIGGHVIHTGQQYTVHSAKLSDSGLYTCTAVNSKGRATSTQTLLVEGDVGVSSVEKQGRQAGARLRQLRSATTTESIATSPSEGNDFGDGSFIAIITVCGLLALAMIIVIVVVSILCCIAAVKSCHQWAISRKTGDKAHLIQPEDDEESQEGSPGKVRKNGSVAMAGVAAALTADDSNINTKSKKDKKKKKPRAGFRVKKVKPQMESDEVPIITHVDDPWPENEDEPATDKTEEVVEQSTQLIDVENGVKKEEEGGLELSTISESKGEVLRVEAEVVVPAVMVEVSATEEKTPSTKTPEQERMVTEETPALVPAPVVEDKVATEVEKKEEVPPASTATATPPEGERKAAETKEEPPVATLITTADSEPAIAEKKQEEPAVVTPEPEGEKKVAEKKEEAVPAPSTTPEGEGKAVEKKDEASAKDGVKEDTKKEDEAPPTKATASEEAEQQELEEKAKKLGRSLSFVKQLNRSHPLDMTEISQLIYGQASGDEYKNDSLFQEYNSIPQNTPTITQSPGQKARNRYRNVLPNPHSAVKLTYIGEDGSTYINANYIQGYKTKNAYIATQGPTADTMGDFWRMIWEQNVSLIVMLTGIVERGRHKCAKYWPSVATNNTGVMEYGFIRVQNNSEESNEYFNVSSLTITNTEQELPERKIYHFAYKAWPDFGVPKESHPLLKLVEVVNKYRVEQQSEAPIVVHCSAGLGRSGAFMAIDTGIHQYEAEGRVDPLKYFCDMRTDRGGTIQTPEQYVFIHKALADYMMAKAK